jgi:flagellar basal body-associated protein FliL
MQQGARREEGGAVLIALLLIVCLLLGLAAGFFARALTGEKKSGKASAAATSTVSTSTKAYAVPVETVAGAAATSFNTDQAMTHVRYLASTIGVREEGTPGEAAVTGALLREFFESYLTAERVDQL